MTNKNISITEDTYRFLKMLKGRDKSFSDVVLELKNSRTIKKGSKEHILKFWGALKDSDWEEKEKRMKEFRNEFEERVSETEKYMHSK